MSDMQYGKKITIESYEAGSLTQTRVQYELPLFTSREQLLHDIIDALAVITKGETTKLEIEIAVDSKGRYKLIKRWKETT